MAFLTLTPPDAHAGLMMAAFPAVSDHSINVIQLCLGISFILSSGAG